MRAALALFLSVASGASGVLITACGAATPSPSLASREADAGARSAAADGGAPLAEAYASFDVLAARGPTDAPLMRELLRVEHAAPRGPDVRAEKDLCLRALFAAPRPVRAWFADETGAPRGEVASGASGAVPPRGPACARKGEALHLVVEGVVDLAPGAVAPPAAQARAVIFAAP